tara:strand:+ start:87 stop:1016 length:930 start_codon:yes stop_codon:yes gene_type:complete
MSLGLLLQQTRESRGKSLEEVSRHTGTIPKVLQDLESGQFQTIEPVYARIAAANYGSYLGLDPKEITAAFDAEFGRPDIPLDRVTVSRTALINPKLGWYRNRPISLTLIGVTIVIVISAIYFFFGVSENPVTPYYESNSSNLALNLVDLPLYIKPSAPIEVHSKLKIKHDQADNAPTLIQNANEDFERNRTNKSEPKLVLRVEAIDSTWVEIQSDSSGDISKQVIPSGEIRHWKASEFFLVTAGRAHGARFYFQEQLLGNGHLGDRTKVLRFRASAENVVLLGRNLEPLSQVSLSESLPFKNHERLKIP